MGVHLGFAPENRTQLPHVALCSPTCMRQRQNWHVQEKHNTKHIKHKPNQTKPKETRQENLGVGLCVPVSVCLCGCVSGWILGPLPKVKCVYMGVYRGVAVGVHLGFAPEGICVYLCVSVGSCGYRARCFCWLDTWGVYLCVSVCAPVVYLCTWCGVVPLHCNLWCTWVCVVRAQT